LRENKSQKREDRIKLREDLPELCEDLEQLRKIPYLGSFHVPIPNKNACEDNQHAPVYQKSSKNGTESSHLAAFI
jgi:hypothetical protein